jgi:hypothetical protein
LSLVGTLSMIPRRQSPVVIPITTSPCGIIHARQRLGLDLMRTSTWILHTGMLLLQHCPVTILQSQRMIKSS